MSTTRGLYDAVQRHTINQILKLATSEDKGKIVKAFNLAAKITPEAHRGELLFVRDKIIDDHPALNLARHVTHQLSPKARDRFIECFVINTMLRGSAKRGHAHRCSASDSADQRWRSSLGAKSGHTH